MNDLDDPGPAGPPGLVAAWGSAGSPVLTVRCADCRTRVGEVRATGLGLLLRSWCPKRAGHEPVEVDAADAGRSEEIIAAEQALYGLRWRVGEESAWQPGASDRRGEVRALDRPDPRRSPEYGCRRHGHATIDEAAVLAAAERAGRTGRAADRDLLVAPDPQ